MPRPTLALLCGLLSTATALGTPEPAPAGYPCGWPRGEAMATADPSPGMSKLWPWNVGGDASWYARPYGATQCPQGTGCPAPSSSAAPGVTEAVPDAPLHLEVRVPADASVWVAGVATTQTGTVRQYVSQPLPVGPTYLCKIRATWRQGGHDVTEARLFTVQAGQHLSMDLLRPDSVEVHPGPERKALAAEGQAP
jgi:uncharacterized protein (TIGR03000 family)